MVKVILAGLPKCGTKTMVAAFEKLGYSPICDVLENFEWFGREWENIFDHGASPADFRRMYENIDVLTDTPMCNFWEEIMEAFPNCKIVFTERKNEHEWVKSMVQQFRTQSSLIVKFMINFSPTARRFKRYMDKLAYATFSTPIHRHWIGDNQINEMIARQRYRQHCSYVKNKCPKDQLLMYDFKQGWDPLCKFLGKQIPSEPFPHENKKGGVTEKFLQEKPFLVQMKKEMYFVVFIFSTFGVTLAAFLAHYFWS